MSDLVFSARLCSHFNLPRTLKSFALRFQCPGDTFFSKLASFLATSPPVHLQYDLRMRWSVTLMGLFFADSSTIFETLMADACFALVPPCLHTVPSYLFCQLPPASTRTARVPENTHRFPWHAAGDADVPNRFLFSVAKIDVPTFSPFF